MVDKKKTPTRKADFSAFNNFLNEFRSESDRAGVILGAARLDHGLYRLLQHFLLPNTSANDGLLDGDSPLSTFSSRINICYRLGLIDAQVTRCLHLIRKIRNIFAHETTKVSLSTGSHNDRVRELSTPFLKSPAFVEFRNKYFSKFDGASQDFRAVLAILVIRLDGGLDYIEPISTDTSISLFPPSFTNPDDIGGENKSVTKEAPCSIE